ncbi:hypothetical protein [Brevibacillus nitrificans]|uniref:hypothetical protein n=1 Tax=Brevibacillus nitrificans TaxID=651560 RepID=UPI002858F7D4|nr:hypothetical protein [Brevibacillus nitrificans]MDR7318891.1 hypothetical protein [Brevibacillus nitrificans]
MQAGRELDALVAGALKGWEPAFIEHLKENDGWILIPHYSTDWRRMGELVDEAKKQGILLEYEHFTEGRYLGRAWKYHEDSEDWVSIPRDFAIKPPIASSVPHAVSLAFLQMKNTAI